MSLNLLGQSGLIHCESEIWQSFPLGNLQTDIRPSEVNKQTLNGNPMANDISGFYRRAYSGLPADIWVMSGAMFVNRFGTMVLPFLALYLTESRGYSESQAGGMLSVYGIGSMIGSWMGGQLVRPIGPIRLQIALFILAVPAYLALPFLVSPIALAAGLITLSIFVEGTRPANSTAVAMLAPDELQTRAFGLQRLALNLGVSFGPAIGGFLATVSFVWLFVVDASTTFLCAMVLMGWFGWKRNASQEGLDAKLRSTPGRSSASPMRDGSFVIFFLLVLSVAIVFFQFHVTYPLYLRDHYGLSKPATGLVYAVNTVVVVVFEMSLLEFVRKWPTMKVIAWGGFFSCLGFGILPFGNSIAYCVLSMLVITLGEMLWMPLASAWVAQRSVRGDRGRYMGWYAMTYSVAALIAPILGGKMAEWNPESFWYLSLVMAVFGFAGFRMLGQRLEAESLAVGP